MTESVLPVTTNGQAGGAAAECLIFPTLSGTTEGLKIKVATKGTNSADRTDTYEIRVPVVGGDGEVRKDENGKHCDGTFPLPAQLRVYAYHYDY